MWQRSLMPGHGVSVSRKPTVPAGTHLVVGRCPPPKPGQHLPGGVGGPFPRLPPPWCAFQDTFEDCLDPCLALCYLLEK